MNDENIKQDNVNQIESVIRIETTPSVSYLNTGSEYTDDKDNYNTTKEYNEHGLITKIYTRDQETWEYRKDLDSVKELTYDEKMNLKEILFSYNYNGWSKPNYIKTVFKHDDLNNVIEEKETEGYISMGKYIESKVNRLKTYLYTYDKYNNWTKIVISDVSYENGKEKKNQNDNKVISRSIRYYFKNEDVDYTH